MEERHWGLALTENSKAGWAFGLPRSKTCIHATKICWRLCYGNSVRYQSPPQKNKRLRNYNTIEFLLDRGGPELLAENLVMLIDQARPADFIAARISGKPTRVPWSVRIHDTGDYPAEQIMLQHGKSQSDNDLIALSGFTLAAFSKMSYSRLFQSLQVSQTVRHFSVLTVRISSRVCVHLQNILGSGS